MWWLYFISFFCNRASTHIFDGSLCVPAEWKSDKLYCIHSGSIFYQEIYIWEFIFQYKALWYNLKIMSAITDSNLNYFCLTSLDVFRLLPINFLSVFYKTFLSAFIKLGSTCHFKDMSNCRDKCIYHDQNSVPFLRSPLSIHSFRCYASW